MQMRLVYAGGLALGASGASATGPIPVDPSDMLHLLVSQSGTSLELEFETTVFDTPAMIDLGVGYAGDAGVLNGRGYNSQYGWLADGFFNLPFGSAIFVRPVTMDPGLSFYDEFSYDPILTTDGSPEAWQWTGQMTHNWVAAYQAGFYEATLEAYVGSAVTGEALIGWGSATIDLEWFMPGDPFTGPTLAGGSSSASSAVQVAAPVPAPGTAAVLGVAGLGMTRRRR